MAKFIETMKQSFDPINSCDICDAPRYRQFAQKPPKIRLPFRQQLWWLLAIAGLTRLLTLGSYPLTDLTEARYGEIARKILETGQWIMPQIDYGVPFWGKPPLSFWLTAISFKLIGVSEFAARIPSFLLSIAICMLVFVLGRCRNGVDHGLRASVVTATSLLMMVCAGSVMTDPAMVLGTTLSMVAFWLASTTSSRAWGYVFFLGLAIGLLAKGPVATVLTLAPIGIWSVLTGRIRTTWQGLPWITGTTLTALLIVPWYWAAEAESPGFLHYFLIGEHWQRYTVSGWNGDLYGSGHPSPAGTIWLYALLGTLPWSPWLLWQLLRGKVNVALTPLRSTDGWMLYLVCWLFVPVAFFTTARNILPTYVLPSLAGFGLLVADVWTQRHAQENPPRAGRLGLVTPVLGVLVVLVIWPYVGFQSQREILSAYQDDLRRDVPLVYYKRRPYSAQFYSLGSAREIDDEALLRRTLAEPGGSYVATERTALEQMPDDLRQWLKIVAVSRTGKYVLLREEAGKQLVDATLSAPTLSSAQEEQDVPNASGKTTKINQHFESPHHLSCEQHCLVSHMRRQPRFTPP
mgnify:CR=1 FL=1